MERWHVKVISLFLVFTITEIATLLPLKVSSYFQSMGTKGIRILSYMMCFGGGVFLGLYMLHMAADVRDILNASLIKPNNIKYPLADFIIVIGFFLMLFSEKAMMRAQNKKYKKKQELLKTLVIKANEGNGVHISPQDRDKAATEVVQYETSFNEPDEAKYAESHDLTKQEDKTRNGNAKSPAEHEAMLHTSAEGAHGHGHHLIVTRSLMLLLALSLHHVFEGISVGLQYSSQAVWNLTIAILSHEVVIAFSLGMQLVHAYKSRKRIIIAATMCSAMAPFGLLIGMLIMELGKSQGNNSMEIINGVLQAISTGVFIYITFFEILASEISHDDSDMAKLFFILFGFLVLAALGLIPEDSQGRFGPDLPIHNDTDTLQKMCNITSNL